MANVKGESVLVTCMDLRLQQAINNWTGSNLASGSFDRVAWAGGVKELEAILTQIELSKQLHDIKRVILCNHEDCGAYGAAGTPEVHANDLRNAAKVVAQKTGLKVQTYYILLNGTFQEVE
jgi:carbonic anhydrase